VLGLTWEKLDLERGTVEVSAQLDRKGKIIRPTKTKRERTIPLSAKAVSVLGEHGARMERDGYAVDETALVFVTARGLPQSRRNALRAWQTALAKIGITDAGLHSLRHTFVSWLAEENVSAVVASELVGHSRVSTTTDYYTRVRGGDAERIERLRGALRRREKATS
jgi:integrase